MGWSESNLAVLSITGKSVQTLCLGSVQFDLTFTNFDLLTVALSQDEYESCKPVYI